MLVHIKEQELHLVSLEALLLYEIMLKNNFDLIPSSFCVLVYFSPSFHSLLFLPAYPQSLSVSDLRSGQNNTGYLSQCPPIPPLVLGTQQDRAKTALGYISKGLDSLNFLECSKTMQWNSACQLLQKASHAYWILTESAMGLSKLGRALRYLKYCILCSSKSG